MVALEAKYHTKCLVRRYNRVRKVTAKGLKGTGEEEVMSRIAFAELLMYIEETQYSYEDKAPVFKLSDLAQLYVWNGAAWNKTGYKITHNTTQATSFGSVYGHAGSEKKGKMF